MERRIISRNPLVFSNVINASYLMLDLLHHFLAITFKIDQFFRLCCHVLVLLSCHGRVYTCYPNSIKKKQIFRTFFGRSLLGVTNFVVFFKVIVMKRRFIMRYELIFQMLLMQNLMLNTIAISIYDLVHHFFGNHF